MKKFIYLLPVLFGALFYAQDKKKMEINFMTKGLKKGVIYVAVYDKEEDFLKVPLAKSTASIEYNGTDKTIVINDLEANKTYAVSAYLDENGNAKLDKNSFGIPLEAYGFSNNARGRFGPPSFKKTAVKLDDDIQLEITLK